MTAEKRDFSKEAATWDENPVRVKLAQDICAAISAQVPCAATTHLLDFGCGTGLLTLELAPRVAQATGVDSAPGMLEVLEAKAQRLGLHNVRTLLLDPDAGAALAGRYDIIVSSMALHHVQKIGPLLRQFYACLNHGGHLCIADLDLDNGQFHSDHTGVFHHGFARDALQRDFAEAGFTDIRDTTAATVTRPAADGVVRDFTVFLMTARRA